jgi:hypothetical protein
MEVSFEKINITEEDYDKETKSPLPEFSDGFFAVGDDGIAYRVVVPSRLRRYKILWCLGGVCSLSVCSCVYTGIFP